MEEIAEEAKGELGADAADELEGAEGVRSRKRSKQLKDAEVEIELAEMIKHAESPEEITGTRSTKQLYSRELKVLEVKSFSKLVHLEPQKTLKKGA